MNCKEKIGFSQSRIYIFIVSNGGKLYLVAVLIMIVTAAIGFKKTFQIYRLLYVLVALSIAVILTGFYLRKFACEITIDFKKNSVNFDMIRGANIALSFDDILEIQVRRNVIFVLKGKKILYNGIQDKFLIDSLNRLKSEIKGNEK